MTSLDFTCTKNFEDLEVELTIGDRTNTILTLWRIRDKLNVTKYEDMEVIIP